MGYVPEERRLEIYAKKLAGARELAVLTGKCLFNNDNHFFPDEPGRRYTLDPIRQQGRGILTCSDVNRLNRVGLGKIDMTLPGNCKQTLSSETCLFSDRHFLTPYLKSCVSIEQAIFLLHVAGLPSPRKLTISTPNSAIFHRADGVDAICFQWMQNRKLVQ